ncbi:hypothetical protein A4H97_18855 [Niastella yeongjuensis]|uniref:RagB/SusD family nutrient uptake outer membrane protein n=1 Tax=Niastella yeongjuensis TaxID=354355 RepID=A0A1V9DY27_9BACT|nr:RagB/SusD family nutrient uptake outer membrane protein [Niastella yeongjuensis]OQP38778.1 hypothetical protein A4H97_18855 [Niastella yeongjuensis]SEO32949.1 Starch-binding associating with outer membrane [Niastella yeongjuensis]
MKRNYKLTIVAAALLAGIIGCKKDFLEEKRDLGGVNEEVFKDSLEAQAYVDYIYGLFQPAAGQPAALWNIATNNTQFDQVTEELPGEVTWNKVWANVSYVNAQALNYFGTPPGTSIANNTWTRMKQINLFLDNIDKYGLPEGTRTRLKGQMYYWRAFQYFDLVRLYGGVPLVLHSQAAVAAADNPDLKVPRSSTSETFTQIYADLDSAITMLPAKWVATDWGRITSVGALAFKGRVALTYASPLFNRNDDGALWQKAYDINKAAKDLADKSGFGLYKSGVTTDGSAFENVFLKELDNPEALILYGFNTNTSDQIAKANGWENSCRAKEFLGGGSLNATKQMMDAFPMKDGKKIDEPGNYIYGLDSFYKDRDPRFYKTFAYNGAKWPYKENPNARVWTYKWYPKFQANTKDTVLSGTTELKGANSSGVYVRKATSPNASNNTNGSFALNGLDYMELRYTELLLNLAEAAVGINNLGDAMTYLKNIRERAGIENRDGSYGLSAVSGRDPMFAAVLNERKIELAYEGKRFWDLRRWMLFNNDFGTCARLGVKPLDGTRRTGIKIIVYKDKAAGTLYIADAKSDPFSRTNYTATSGAPILDRDNTTTYPAGVAPNQDSLVNYLYRNYFVVKEKDDLESTAQPNTIWNFKWYNEYYFFGLNQAIINNSPYLEQTKGWDGLYGPGTFDPLKF